MPHRFLAVPALAIASALFACSDNEPASALEIALRTTLDAAVADERITGYALEVGRPERPLLRISRDIDPAETVAVASAAKGISAVVIAMLVDEQRLDLDQPISQWLDNAPAGPGELTLQELLTHSHRLRLDPQHECLNGDNGNNITLRQCADEILDAGLTTWSGFRYGASGYQVAGAVAEAATGARWQELVQTRLNDTLGVDFQYFPEDSDNPRVGGGMLASLQDLATFQRALLARDPNLLPPEMHDALRDRRVPVDTALVPPGVEAEQYGLGQWIDTPDGSAGPELSSPGAFGTVPWLDDDRRYYAVLVLHQSESAIGLELMRALRAEILDRLP